MQARRLLHSWLFIASLSLLLINDFYLKFAWPGAISGKLSDFAGITMFCLLMFALLPRNKVVIGCLIALTFIWWKSPLSSVFIHWARDLGFNDFSRVVDYWDLTALLMIPLCVVYASRFRSTAAAKRYHRVYQSIMVGVAAFATMATSQIRTPYTAKYELIVDDRLSPAKVSDATHRVLSYYNYRCVKNCSSNYSREYQDSLGTINFEFDKAQKIARYKHFIIYGGKPLLSPFPERDIVKHMTKIRDKIARQIMQDNPGVKLKTTVDPDNDTWRQYKPPGTHEPASR